MRKILISGAHGFIARNFCQRYAHKYQFILLSHQASAGYYTLDQLEQDPQLLSNIVVVINLAGANIGAKRWTPARKAELLNSRLSTTQRLVSLFNRYQPKAQFISASAVGVYAPLQVNTEETPLDYSHYDNFSQEITRQWEQAARSYQGQLCITRFGVVFAGRGGAFPQMLQPFKLGVGGRIGDGQQFLPWIALEDLLRALDWLISTQASGIFNLVAPELINNQELTRQIARIWQRPAWFNLPARLIKLIFGQLGQELFLNSLQVAPLVLERHNFTYHYPRLSECLQAIKNGDF